jgi:hypothetical protein
MSDESEAAAIFCDILRFFATCSSRKLHVAKFFDM